MGRSLRAVGAGAIGSFLLDESGDAGDAFGCLRIVPDLGASLPEQFGIDGVTEALGGCGTPVGTSWSGRSPRNMAASAPQHRFIAEQLDVGPAGRARDNRRIQRFARSTAWTLIQHVTL